MASDSRPTTLRVEPKDRVVPSEMVPPGLPVQMLEPPQPALKPDIPVQSEQDTTP
jgi:hypothetical protein